MVSLNSDDAELMRHLNTEAAKAMKYGGVTETEALAMVTINPAKQLGIDNRVGSIEVGKDADLVIYDKYPLSDFAKVQKVLIDGTVYFDRDKEVSDQAAKAAEKQKLVDKLKQQQHSRRTRRTRRERRPMKFVGLLLSLCDCGAGRRERYLPDPQRGCLSGDGQGDEGRLRADSGRQDRRNRRPRSRRPRA